jgi:hypothetical protein
MDISPSESSLSPFEVADEDLSITTKIVERLKHLVVDQWPSTDHFLNLIFFFFFWDFRVFSSILTNLSHFSS